METTGSPIVDFYKNKHVLLTGATGFLGKLILEQILRKCDPATVYILVRNKKGINSADRLNEILDKPIFDKLKNLKPEFVNKIKVMFGDMALPDLGLDEKARSLLVDRVQIVIHSAATVNFEEHIKKATFINVRGTKLLTQLCRNMKQLEVFLHISTAFCNCPKKEIEEVLYDPPISGDNLIRLVESVDDETLSAITPGLLRKWPNTYTYTKLVAENTIKEYSEGLPVSIFRPAIIVTTNKDPIPGWVESLYSVVGLTAGTIAGLIRVAHVNPSVHAEIIPADMTVHGILAAAYKTSVVGPSPDIPVFNYASSPDNPLNWGNFLDISMNSSAYSVLCVYYPCLILISSYLLFKIASFVLHIFPAFLIDIFLLIIGKEPKALKIYSKVTKFLAAISYFAGRSWVFKNGNVRALWSGLNEKDRELFDFDLKGLNWEDFVIKYNWGVRNNILKDPPETADKALRKMFWLHILHRTLQAVFFVSAASCVWFVAACVY